MSVQSFDPQVHQAAASVAFVPAPEIVSELLISKLPREARACLTALTLEIGPVWTRSWSPFLCLYGFVEWTGSLATFPTWPGATGPTGEPTSAAGPWQDERGTDEDISKLTGDIAFAPQDQINKNWVLAVRDYGRRTSGDLLSDLKSGSSTALDKVQQALVGTWPAGADVGFKGRYTAALKLFPVDQPVPPVLPSSSLPTILVGDECRLTITAATDDAGGSVLAIPTDLLKPDDSAICTATIAAMTLAIAGLAAGKTMLRGADQVIPVIVAARPVTHLKLDFSSAVCSPIGAVAKAMIARLPMMAMVIATMVAGSGSLVELETPNPAEPSQAVAATSPAACSAKDLRWLLDPSPCR